MYHLSIIPGKGEKREKKKEKNRAGKKGRQTGNNSHLEKN